MEFLNRLWSFFLGVEAGYEGKNERLLLLWDIESKALVPYKAKSDKRRLVL